MMLGSFSIFSPLIISALVIWVVAALAIRFDLHRMHRELPQAERASWYARPILWFAASGISLGLALTAIASPFAYHIGWLIAFGFALLFTLLLIGAIIVALEHPFSERDPSVEEARLRQLAASSPGTVANTGIVANVFVVGIIIYAILMGTVTLLVFMPGKILFIFIVWLILLVALIVRMFVLKRLTKRLNRWRHASISEKKWPLVAEKPQPATFERVSSEPIQMLTPPLVLRLKWWIISGYLVIMAAFTLSWLSHTAMPILAMFQILIYLYGFLIVLLRGQRESVEATSEGLVVSQGVWLFRRKRYQQRIRWENARLFACYKTPGFFGGKATMTYELSNARQVVRWTRLIDTHSFLTPWKIEVSTEEYNQRTQALCACITEQTGLQLHDISEESSTEHEQEILAQARAHN